MNKLMRSHPKIYITTAKLCKTVYWARKIIGFESEKVGEKIARLYIKYGEAVVEKRPEETMHCFSVAYRYAPPRWKRMLLDKMQNASEKCPPRH